jgi:histidinol-phosphatase (PHP family)
VLALAGQDDDPHVDHRHKLPWVPAVLTDYHVHLRPDELDATASKYFTEQNVERYLDSAREAGVSELGASEHIHRFADALEIWGHPFWRRNATDDLAAYCEFVSSTPLKLGIEMDYVPGREDRIATVLDSHDFDYVIGSVHFIGDRSVDDPEFDVWDRDGDPDRLWRRYFEVVAEAARAGLYDILAHPDLVKVWGHGRPQPRLDVRFHYEPAIEAIAETGVAVEVSTAGWRKPVEELYPAAAFAEMCVEAGAAFALSSDAHVPADVGHRYERAVEVMRGWGIKELATFSGRERTMEPLG